MKKVVFCLPGREFSNNFLKSWSSLLLWCTYNNIQPILSSQYSPLLYYVRNMCLGGDVTKGIEQKPFNDQIDYDYIMWIDSDIVFEPSHFKALIDADQDIVSGLYKMANNTHFATVKNWDEEFYKKNGHFQFLSPSDIHDEEDLFEVDYTGFGWILIKNGVFESLEYPWFQPMWSEFKTEGKIIRDFSMEDVAFCRMIQNKGYKIYIDPKVIVGHEKSFII